MAGWCKGCRTDRTLSEFRATLRATLGTPIAVLLWHRADRLQKRHTRCLGRSALGAWIRDTSLDCDGKVRLVDRRVSPNAISQRVNNAYPLPATEEPTANGTRSLWTHAW